MLAIIFSFFLFLIYAALILYYRQGWIDCEKFGLGRDAMIASSIEQSGETEYWGRGTQFEVKPVSISVIIPARNEEKNIKSCLESIAQQKYPKELYEIIVADDFSTDATATIVKNFAAKNLTLISLDKIVEPGSTNAYKKKAIEIAIGKAAGDLIVTTDADCIVPINWLNTIADFYAEYKPTFIAAPVAYTQENSFLSIFQSLDFMTLQGITGASVFKKFHSMCNGANLAYEKKVFYEVKGFEGVDHIASGDDMLLMHKIATLYPDRVKFLCSKNAIVNTSPMPTVKGFLNQRIRWASKTGSYTDKKIVVVLAIVYIFNVWILVAGIICFFNYSILPWCLGMLIGKIIVELFFLYPVASFFNKKKLLWWFSVAQPFHVVYTIVAGWMGRFGKYEWKGRSEP